MLDIYTVNNKIPTDLDHTRVNASISGGPMQRKG